MDTKTRLINAMSDALLRKGLNGSGIADILVAAGAPKGVLYHHFPGGKKELAVAAVNAAIARICDSLERRMAVDDPAKALMDWVDSAERRLAGSEFQTGCPLATIALESTPEDVEIRAALAAGFLAIRQRVADGLVRAGFAAEQAAGLAALIVAAYEGGLIQARVAGNVEPMRLVSACLGAVLKGAQK